MLALPQSLLDRILAEALAAAPREACGILGGRDVGERRVVEVALACRNVAPHPEWEFTAHPQDQLEALLAIEERGLESLGVWHSHPRGPAGPSAVDAQRAAFPGWSHIVVALQPTVSLGAWRWEPPDFVPELVQAQP